MNNRSIAAPGAQAFRTLIRAVHDELWLVREPERAVGQQRYMKSSMPFMGVRAPVMRKTARAVFDRYPPARAGDWRATILALWREASYREFFVQKAMGWALRDYARTGPGEIRRYVGANGSRLSNLTRREALKNLA